MESSSNIERLLKDIVYNTSAKEGFDVVLSGKSTQLFADYSPELKLEGRWGIALQNLSTYNSIPNIDNTNNMFKYFNGSVWKTITIGTGSYEIEELNNEIIRLMKVNGDYDNVNDVSYITIEPNLSRLTSEIHLENGYKVDFDFANSLASVLGFGNIIVDKAYTESKLPITIIDVNSILVHCDLVQSSFYNGKIGSIIYDFPITTSPGYRMVSTPTTLRYHNIITNTIGTMRVWLTDDKGKVLDLRKELVTISLRFQKNMKLIV